MLTTDYIYNGTLPALKSLLTLLTKIPQYLQKLAPQAIPPLLHTPPSPLPPLVHSLEKPQTAPPLRGAAWGSSLEELGPGTGPLGAH